MRKARPRQESPSVVSIIDRAGFFAEDKDVAALVREECIRPAIVSGRRVVLDFEGVVGATQSFIHALIAAVIREDGIDALEMLEFKSCAPSLKGIISIVVDYCQLDVGHDEVEPRGSREPAAKAVPNAEAPDATPNIWNGRSRRSTPTPAERQSP